MNKDKEEKILAAKAVFEKWDKERYPIKMYSQEGGWGEGEIYDTEKFVPVYAPFLTLGRYYVSDTGYVMSCLEPNRDKKDGTCPHILKPQKDPNDKYYLITLWEDGKKYSYPVHRMVWFSFAHYAIENNAPEYLPKCFEPIDIANTLEAKKTLEKYFYNTPHTVKRRIKEENPTASEKEIQQIIQARKPEVYMVHHIKGYDQLENAKPGIVNNVENLELVRTDLHGVLNMLASTKSPKSPDDILAEIARKSPDDQISIYVRGTNYHQNEREAYVLSADAMKTIIDK